MNCMFCNDGYGKVRMWDIYMYVSVFSSMICFGVVVHPCECTCACDDPDFVGGADYVGLGTQR